MSAVFEVTAYDGRRIRLTEVQLTHIIFFHPEVKGEQNKIQEVLQTPDTVIVGATEDTMIYYKFYPSTPVASKHLTIVVRVLNKEGFIITSYFTERMRKGKILWRKPKS